VIRRALDLIGSERCAGFLTEEVRGASGGRLGFDVVTLDGRHGRLARAGAPGPRVGRYGVDVHGFEGLGVAALEAGIAAGARILVVDEIGKMELYSRRFLALVERVLNASSAWAVLGTVMQRRPRALSWLEGRADLRLVEVTRANRESLPTELGRIYGEYLRTGPR
jgi:nucleoside-triphosphatase